MKKIINVTDITSYLYCPRKLWLKLVKKIKEPPNRKMILGMLKHKVFDIFNKNEPSIVSSIKEADKKQIKSIYLQNLTRIISEVYYSYENMASSFAITKDELLKSILKSMNREIELRADSISFFLEKGFLGKELWRNLTPKYLTEYEIISEELGLKGRVDRIKLGEKITPYEIKTRDEIYESDKLQLAAYSLLLEKEFNKEINKGIIELVDKQEEVEITDELKSKVLEIAEKIRDFQEPQFSSNFAKCKDCSLKEECFQ